MVLVAAILVPIGVYIVAAIYFGIALGLIGQISGASADAHGIGESAGAIAMMFAAAMGGGGAVVSGASAKTTRGARDPAALVLGIVLGVPLAIFAVTRLVPGLDALLNGHKPGGLLAGGLFLFLGSWIGDRLFKQR